MIRLAMGDRHASVTQEHAAPPVLMDRKETVTINMALLPELAFWRFAIRCEDIKRQLNSRAGVVRIERVLDRDLLSPPLSSDAEERG